MNETIIEYLHHNRMMSVYADDQGLHKNHCLCYDCARFNPGEPFHCHIASDLYEFDKKYGVTTPVWECEFFRMKQIVDL